MSRCFPFPPPGYERKARNDDKDLLEKDKHGDKKQKKEKKDKEKTEGKEKRDKDRSDGKHREKKDKKENHKERGKERDRDKAKDKTADKEPDEAKDKSKVLDEKRLSVHTGPHCGEKLGQRESKEKNNSVHKKFSGQVGGHKVEKLGQNSNLVDKSKFFADFDRRIRDDASGTGNHLENFSGIDQKKDEGMFRLVAKSASTLAAIKEKGKSAEVKSTDGQGTREGTRPGGNAMVQATVGAVTNKFDGLPRLLDKNVERKMEGNKKPKDKESDNKRGAKSQEKDKEKKSHGKDKERDRDKKKESREKRKEDKQKKKEEKQRKKEDREKKKEDKAKEKTQLQNAELDKLRGSNQHNFIDNHAVKTPQLHMQSNISAPTDANQKKRKDFETNGVVHAHDALSSKMPRPTPSPHPPLQNGRILEHGQTSVLATERNVADHNTKMYNKERTINGISEPQLSSVSPMKVQPATPAADQMSKPSTRPPHPDTKYLSLIYSVPKMVEWSDYDDQEWLFSSNASQTKKPKVHPSGSEQTLQVWAEAQQIESADIFALPFVIPY